MSKYQLTFQRLMDKNILSPFAYIEIDRLLALQCIRTAIEGISRQNINSIAMQCSYKDVLIQQERKHLCTKWSYKFDYIRG
jgi:hypothetical protein